MGGNASKTSAGESLCRTYHNCTICDKRFYILKQVNQNDGPFGRADMYLRNYTFVSDEIPTTIYFMHNANGFSVDIFSADTGELLYEAATLQALKDPNNGQLEDTTRNLKIMPKPQYPYNGMVMGQDYNTPYYQGSFLTRLRGYTGGKSLKINLGAIVGQQLPLRIENATEIVFKRIFDRPDNILFNGEKYSTGLKAKLFPVDKMEVIETILIPFQVAIGTDALPATDPKFWGGFPGSSNYRTNCLFAYYFPPGTPANLTRIDVFADLKLNKGSDGIHAGIFVYRQDPPIFEGEFGSGGKFKHPTLRLPASPLDYPAGNMVNQNFTNNEKSRFEMTLTGDIIQNLAGSYLVFNANLPRFLGYYLEVHSFAFELI